jgi:hypothetical protein
MMKIEGVGTNCVYFKKLFKSVGVGVGGIVSDYC